MTARKRKDLYFRHGNHYIPLSRLMGDNSMNLQANKALRPLGSSDLMVSSIAYGYWRFAGTDVQTALGKVEAALE